MDKIVNIHPNAQIGENVVIESFVSIAADVIIGDGTWIGPMLLSWTEAELEKTAKFFRAQLLVAYLKTLNSKAKKQRLLLAIIPPFANLLP